MQMLELIRAINSWFSAHQPWDKVAHFAVAFISCVLFPSGLMIAAVAVLATAKEFLVDENAKADDIIAAVLGGAVGWLLGQLL